jgi:cytoskeletal protein RodZ
LSIHPQAAPSSSNLDYLLEDEEEPRRGGAGKFVLILLALVLAGGFGYLRWKNQKFGWLGSSPTKHSATAQSDTTDANSAMPPAPSTTGAPATTPAIQPATDASAPPPASPTTANPAPSSSATNSPAAGTAPASAAPTTSDNAAPSTATPSNTPPATAAPAAAEPAASAPDTPAAATPKPAKPADAPPTKPAAAIKPAKPFDPVTEAQKYIYGKGVQQDCDRGMRILKPAVNQSNPKAMIEMGALYSAGLCTPRDLPTAYRWFALALRKEPDNQAVQADLQKLWGEMTQPERQLAIKLSQ